MADNCCAFCSIPLKFGMLSLRNYIVELHDMLHEVESLKKTVCHLEKRLQKVSDDMKETASQQLSDAKASYKKALLELKALRNSEYFPKIQLHYKEASDTLKQCYSKVLNSKEALSVLK